MIYYICIYTYVNIASTELLNGMVVLYSLESF